MQDVLNFFSKYNYASSDIIPKLQGSQDKIGPSFDKFKTVFCTKICTWSFSTLTHAVTLKIRIVLKFAYKTLLSGTHSSTCTNKNLMGNFN